jgi:nitrile hydratase
VSYRIGQEVRIAARAHDGHHRTPAYAKGKVGRVERRQGAFKNPETRAYGEHGLPDVALYLVSFEEGDARVYLDVYEHWLEAAE